MYEWSQSCCISLVCSLIWAEPITCAVPTEDERPAIRRARSVAAKKCVTFVGVSVYIDFYRHQLANYFVQEVYTICCIAHMYFCHPLIFKMPSINTWTRLDCQYDLKKGNAVRILFLRSRISHRTLWCEHERPTSKRNVLRLSHPGP